MEVKYKQTSNYSITPMNKKFLELYEPALTEATLSEESRLMVIQPKYDRRPDLLAFDLYGNPRLWWIFVHYNRNTIKDPIMDFTSGKKIQVPTSAETYGAN